MQIKILGCGALGGVPLIGCNCAVCQSPNPRNKRRRAAIFVEHNGGRLLVDTSPDLRQQCLDANIQEVDAVIYTHDHADHTHGIDDVRSFNFKKNGPLDIYSDIVTNESLHARFPYAFHEVAHEYAGWYRPSLRPHVIEAGAMIKAANMEVQSFAQQHGKTQSLGLRIGDFAYSTDVNGLDDAAINMLAGVKVWVVDCLRLEAAPTHAHLEMTLGWIEQVKPERAYLTHMSHGLDYDALCAQLPAHVRPCHDGLLIEL